MFCEIIKPDFEKKAAMTVFFFAFFLADYEL
jgi:hypothetical protein